MNTAIEVHLEAQGAPPNFRYDVIQPLLQGRVPIDGVSIVPSGPMVAANMFSDERFKGGDFGLLDTNWGDLLPAIDAGWDVVLLPVFIKRKPAYNYVWVRANRGIEKPKDLEGKTFASFSYGSAISTFARGLLQHHWDVDLHKLKWLLGASGAFPIHDDGLQITYAEGPRKSPIARLLDGEVDAVLGDILDKRVWQTLEESPQVRRLFPDYQAQNERLLREQELLTPVHVIAMGGRLNRQYPDLARKLFEAFEQSRETAYEDALGDGSGYSLLLGNREQVRDQLATFGDVWRHGMSANRRTVESFLDYNHEQGVTGRRLSVEQVFAEATLDT
jgi:4,5-dihydroxyphthalate decarboxylase